MTKNIPGWVLWIAQDINGQWWGYEDEPNQYDKGWYENEIGRYIKLDKGEPNSEWALSLEKVKP